MLATLIIGVIGVAMQQIFLRWNQGQDLRQALITIALSVILADQMLAYFGGISKDISAPSAWPTSIALPGDVRFGFFRGVIVLAAALADRARAVPDHQAHPLRQDRARRRRRPRHGRLRSAST